MADVILKLDDLTKSFRSQWTFLPRPAVKNISLEIYRGEAFGFLGHNGAGKTTTIKCILGLLKLTSGKILIEGRELRRASERKLIGYLPEQPYFYDHLTVRETCDFFAQLCGIARAKRTALVNETLERVGLSDRLRSPVRALSKGLQQRLGFAQAIINSPSLLFLDEPFSGLDPLGRHEFRNLILDLKRAGTTIFLSSHILSDVEHICDRVSIMKRGQLLKVLSLKEIPNIFGESFEVILQLASSNDEFLKRVTAKAFKHQSERSSSGQIEILRFAEYADALNVVTASHTAGVRVVEFRSCTLSLEEIFVQLTSASTEETTT